MTTHQHQRRMTANSLEWVHKADIQPISTVVADQLAVDEKMIRLQEEQFWLYGAVDLQTNEILHVSLFPKATKRTTRWFLTELHHRYQLDDVVFLIDDADYLAQFWPKTATDSSLLHMEIGTPSNVSFGK